MQIKIDKKLLKCPTCGENLNIKKPKEIGLTTCSSNQCDYKEVAGSPWFTTYAGLLLKAHLEEIQHITKASLVGANIPTSYLFNPRGLLHIFFARSKEVMDLELMGTPLQNMRFDYVPDPSAVFNVRVVLSLHMENEDYDSIAEGLTQNVLVSTNVIDETLKNTSKITKNKARSLVVEHIPEWNSRVHKMFPENNNNNSSSAKPGM